MEGGMMRCGFCGLERQRKVSDCKLIEVLARNVALEEEVKEVKVLLTETRQELRREASVRGEIVGGLWVREAKGR